MGKKHDRPADGASESEPPNEHTGLSRKAFVVGTAAAGAAVGLGAVRGAAGTPATPMRLASGRAGRCDVVCGQHGTDGAPRPGAAAVAGPARLMTIGAAWYPSMEDELGSLEVDKRGDLVVLDHDFTTATDEEFRRIRPLLTLVGGQTVYEA